MKLRAHATSIALLLVAAGTVVYAWVDRGSVTESEKKARSSNVFGAWRREELTRITIDHDAEHIVLERSLDDAGDPEWRMRGPKETGKAETEKANADAIDKLASVLEFANVVRKVDPSAATPASTKLESPRAHGEIAMGKLVFHWALGAETPTPEGSAYLRVDDLGTVVISRDVVAALLQPRDTYRSRAIVPYLSIELGRLEVKSPAGTLAITRVDDVSFTLGNGLRASRSTLDTVWSALAETRAEVFLDPAVAAPLVATPQITITMTPKDASHAAGVLRVGGPCPGNEADVVVVRDAPVPLAACAPKGILTGLTTSDAALVDTHLFAAHDDEIAELRIETLPKGPALDLARKESGWRERAPEERDLSGEDAEAASGVVTGVARSQGIDPSKSDAPFEAHARVTVHRADNDVVEVVELALPDANGDVMARRNLDGARLHVAAAVARKLAPRGVALRGKGVWTPPIEGAPVTSFETRCDGVVQRVTHEGDAWTLRAPAGYVVDNASVLDLIDTFTRARVETWVADVDDGRFGLLGPANDAACTLTFALAGEGGTRTAQIELGHEGEGGVYARTNEGPAVFVAPASLRDHARASLVNLHDFAPADLTKLTLQRAGKRLEIVPDGGDDPALRAANVLRADGVLHLGPKRADDGLDPASLEIVLQGRGGERRITLGHEITTSGTRAFTARVTGTDATFVIDRDRVKPLFDAF